MPASCRGRLLNQIILLAGLRGISESLKMEMKQMGIYKELEDNVIIKELLDARTAESYAEGCQSTLRELLELKFGPLPRWAQSRLSNAELPKLKVWTRKVLVAGSLEAVIGKK